MLRLNGSLWHGSTWHCCYSFHLRSKEICSAIWNTTTSNSGSKVYFFKTPFYVLIADTTREHSHYPLCGNSVCSNSTKTAILLKIYTHCIFDNSHHNTNADRSFITFLLDQRTPKRFTSSWIFHSMLYYRMFVKFLIRIFNTLLHCTIYLNGPFKGFHGSDMIQYITTITTSTHTHTNKITEFDLSKRCAR
jgi:hypothetical protein